MTLSDWITLLDTVTGPSTLDEVRHCLGEAWTQNPEIPGGVRTNILAAAEEIGANIVEHSARGRKVRMTLQFRINTRGVQVKFTDDGPTAIVDLSAVAMPPPLALRGRGLAIAIAVLDDLSYRRIDNLNEWTLTHGLAGQEP